MTDFPRMSISLGSRLVATLVFALAAVAGAQSSVGGVIAGVVHDADSRPVAGADIMIRPGDHRARSDSAGRFTIGGLGADRYFVRARKLGYGPTQFDVALSKGGRVEIRLVFDMHLPMLDTIVVTAGRTCAEFSLEGFVCRRRSGSGVFLDYTDIDDKGAQYTADVFRDMKGLRVNVRPTRHGPERYVGTSLMSGCVTSLVDGRPATAATFVPQFPEDLVAIEVYVRPDSVPTEYRRYTWPAGDVTRSGRCAVIVYWTLRARLRR